MLVKASNSFRYQLRRFQNMNLWYTFQMLFAEKRGLAHSCFLYENEEALQHFLSFFPLRFLQRLHFFWSRSRSGFLTIATCKDKLKYIISPKRKNK